MTIVILIIIVIFSIIIHEVAHGYVARLFGDETAYQAGRLSFNPLKHIDPLGTLIIPLIVYYYSGFIFGWAKPVPINPRLFHDYRKGMIYTSLAGPLSNLTVAFLLSVMFKSLVFPAEVKMILVQGIYLNIVLCFFNLLPIPPLDGSRVFQFILPSRWFFHYQRLEPYGFIILFVCLYYGWLDVFFKLLEPVVKLFL